METAASESEAEPVGRLLLDNVRRWCAGVVESAALDPVGSKLQVLVADETPRVMTTQQELCVEHARHDDPWLDMVELRRAGCLDLGEWIERHRGAVDATASALENCVSGGEIRYQEASCVRELAGLDPGRALSFNPKCSARYCEHAPLMCSLIGLVSPTLDDVILEERWPALEVVDLGSGPRKVATLVGGIPVTLHVAERADGGIDRADHDRLWGELARAREQPHMLTVYARGRAYRLELRRIGDTHDLETLLGGLNTLLADCGSALRFATLDAHCVPCSIVVAGPENGLMRLPSTG